jgi:Tfp pilus assembly protein PilP
VAFQLVGSILCALILFNQVPETAPATVPAVDSLFPIEKWDYRAAGRRDPFVALVGAGLVEGSRASHLSVENLTLIGILWGDRGYYGLVKDGLNQGYILKRGDKVAGGRVAKITRQAIIFEIMHAGVVTKYELRLQEKERR